MLTIDLASDFSIDLSIDAAFAKPEEPMKPPPDDLLDQTLMSAVGRGDSRAFTRLVQRHAGWALGFCERLVGARHEAEDLVQVAFLRVWQGAAQWQPQARFRTWLYRVLYNLCMDQFRARSTAATQPLDDEAAEALHDPAPGMEARLWGQQRDARVRAALAQLPARQRAALVLRYYEEVPQSEAAVLLGLSEGALESLLTRGRARLRQWLGDDLH